MAIGLEEVPAAAETSQKAIFEAIHRHLALKMASAWKPDSAEDYQMRLEGAKCQQLATKVVVGGLGSLMGEETLRRFLKENVRLVYYNCLVDAWEQKGNRRDVFPSRMGNELCDNLMRGIKGEVAVCLLARDAGWQIEYPPLEADVKSGVDLLLRKGDLRCALQVKCQQEGKFSVWEENRRWQNFPCLRVVVPDRMEFFRDWEIGIPCAANARRFETWLQNHLRSEK